MKNKVVIPAKITYYRKPSIMDYAQTCCETQCSIHLEYIQVQKNGDIYSDTTQTNAGYRHKSLLIDGKPESITLDRLKEIICQYAHENCNTTNIVIPRMYETYELERMPYHQVKPSHTGINPLKKEQVHFKNIELYEDTDCTLQELVDGVMKLKGYERNPYDGTTFNDFTGKTVVKCGSIYVKFIYEADYQYDKPENWKDINVGVSSHLRFYKVQERINKDDAIKSLIGREQFDSFGWQYR